ncbi:MAG: hypothetical protein JXB48_00070 [Candidatus Latescibacteria bacterium]|nr:hypothetical protein [Candidatus Latescibacterota bacterium]
MEDITHLQAIDFIVIAVYFAIIIFIGTYFTKYVKQAKDYFTAGANIPWWLAAISFWMATFSSLSFVTYAELGYKYGFTSLMLYCISIPCMLLGAYLFVGRWRRARQMSPIGFIETRFSPALKQIFVWTGFPLRMADNAIRIYATAIFLTAALSSETFTLSRIIWLTGAITLGYSMLGGQWAVIVTDFVQFIILCLAVCMVFPLAVREVNGLGTFFEKMPENFTVLVEPPYDYYQLLTWIILVFFSFNAGWAMIQKYNCVRSERDARRVVYAVAVWSFIGPVIFYIPAMIARVVFSELENPRFAYAVISLKVLPVGLMGVMIAAIFSATLSTLSNEFTMLSSVLTNDFYAGKINPGASQNLLIKIGRINSLIIGVVTITLAVLLQYVQGMNLFDIMVKAYTAFAPAIMAPLLAGVLFRSINSKGALTGIIAGFISGSVLLVLNIILVGLLQEQFITNPRLNYWLNQGWSSTSIILNFGITILGLWLGSRFGTISENERQRTAQFFRQLETPYEIETSAAVSSPFPVIGIIVTVMGAGMSIVAYAVKVIYNRPGWFQLNMLAAAVLLITGISIWLVSRDRKKT